MTQALGNMVIAGNLQSLKFVNADNSEQKLIATDAREQAGRLCCRILLLLADGLC